ncbi:MAG: hypothetical protein JXA89_27420 [Anaerolineae bacterium]|nr:hypothetical protein [Anaerolineae bacterium]
MTKRRQQTQRKRSTAAPLPQNQQEAELPEDLFSDIIPPDPQEARTLIERLQTMRNSSVITLVARPDVTLRGDVTEKVYEQLRKVGRVPRIDLFLHSSGGQTEIPWRLITLIRDFTDRFAVLIPGIAYSAATHLAMGADEIVMGPLSELSPVDPARSHPLLPGRKEEDPPLAVSVQDLRHCVEFVKSEIGDANPESLAMILTALFDKIHPLAIGAIQQSYALSRLISTKALSTHMDPDTQKEQIEQIVNAFTDEFFSHQYRIGWREAQEKGLPVIYADNDLWETMWSLYKHYQAFFSLARPSAENQVAQPIVWIDSLCHRCILEQVSSVTFDQSTRRIQAKKSESHWLSSPWQKDDAEGQA